MKYITVLFFVMLIWAGCSAPQQEEAVNEETEQEMETQVRQDDWVVLFDGTSLDAWRNYNGTGLNDKWQIEGETLVLTEKGGGDIITKDTYGNFELQLEWKISEGGNSGIFYHIIEADSLNTPFLSAPEYQLLDDEKHADGTKPSHRAGSNYDMQAVSEPAVKPVGEWNSTKIIVNGNHVEHWLNGVKVVEFEEGSDSWNEQLASSKFSDWSAYAYADEGHIGLQDHGDKVWFRNIKVKRL